MGALYPDAGSAYTYVGKGLNPHLGFLAGWAMILDYFYSPYQYSLDLYRAARALRAPGPIYRLGS